MFIRPKGLLLRQKIFPEIEIGDAYFDYCRQLDN